MQKLKSEQTVKRTITILGLALIAVFAGSAALRAAKNPAPATPSAALAAFSKAMEEGDSTTLTSLAIGDDKEREWVVAFAKQLRAFSDLDHALAKRFGKGYANQDSGKAIREQIEGVRDEELCVDLKKAKLRKLDGDTTLIIFDESASDDRQGRIVRADGHWKVEIASLANYFSVDDTPGLHAIVDAAAGLARDIDGGKFSTLDDTAKEVENRLTAAQAVAARKPEPTPAANSPTKPK